MKWIIGFFALMAIFVVAIWANISIDSQVNLVQQTFTATFATGASADTVTVAGGAATDKYFVMGTGVDGALNGILTVVAGAGQVIINSTAAETSLTVNVVRMK